MDAREKFQALNTQQNLDLQTNIKTSMAIRMPTVRMCEISNIQIIQRFQNKLLRNIVNASWYVRDKDIHRDLQIPVVADEIKRMAVRHQDRLQHHTNAETLHL